MIYNNFMLVLINLNWRTLGLTYRYEIFKVHLSQSSIVYITNRISKVYK